jgi:hypothetical protein
MNRTMRNLMLSAAALAALTGIAPKASADQRARGRETTRQEVREHAVRGPAYHAPAWRGPARAYVAPRRPVVGYRSAWAASYRVFPGFRFFPYCPGPGYVYVANTGWALPPFFGAVWVPGHYDFDGFWVEGFWR